ncbi:MAG: hypothetical protein ACJ8KU_11835 [Chthoniobacterales bacterium]
MPCRLGVTLLALALGLTARAADPSAELAGFSVFDKIDLAQLAHGDVKVAHGAPMANPRFASVQSVYVAPGTPQQHIAAMDRWNPTGHPDLHVFMHVEGTNLSRLAAAPDNSAVRALAAATTKPSQELQISREEAKKLPVGAPAAFNGPVANFWSEVLSARSRSGAGGPAYDYTGQPIRPGEELRGMLGQQPKIQKQFSGLAGSAVGGGGSKYWELLQVEDIGVLTLGASGNRPGPNGSIQAYDTLYYASGGYYAGLTLYQLWPVTIEGRPSTLVWRGDMISSAALAGLHGIERVASESQMMKDISRAVTSFRRDTGGAR